MKKKKDYKNPRLYYALKDRTYGHGYYGHHRSFNSKAAIMNDVVPISSVNRKFLNSLGDKIKLKHKNIIKFPIEFWKLVAKAYVSPEKHHTGKKFRSTNQYDFKKVAKRIDNNPQKFKNFYKYRLNQKKRKREKAKRLMDPNRPVSFAIMKEPSFCTVHGKTKFAGYDRYFGYVRYSKSGNPYLVTYHKTKSLNANSIIYKHYFGTMTKFINFIKSHQVKVNPQKFNKFLHNHHVLCKIKKGLKPTYNYKFDFTY